MGSGLTVPTPLESGSLMVTEHPSRGIPVEPTLYFSVRSKQFIPAADNAKKPRILKTIANAVTVNA